MAGQRQDVASDPEKMERESLDANRSKANPNAELAEPDGKKEAVTMAESEKMEDDNLDASRSEANPNLEFSEPDRKRKVAATSQVLNCGLNSTIFAEKRKRKVVHPHKRRQERPAGWSLFGLPGWDDPKSRIVSRAIIRNLVKAMPLPFQPKDEAEVEGGKSSKEKPTTATPRERKSKSASVGTKKHSSIARGAPNPVVDTPAGPAPEIHFAEFNDFFRPTEIVGSQAPWTTAAEIPFSSNPRGNLEEVHKRLSSLLAMDFHSLLETDTFGQAVYLSTVLKENAGLNHFQLAMLKMVEQIPLLSDDIVALKELGVQVKAFFAELESNIFRAACLWTQYRESMGAKVDLLGEVSAKIYAAKVLNHQILELQAQRLRLASLLESKKNAMIELISAQNQITAKGSEDEQVEARDPNKPAGGTPKKKPVIDDWEAMLSRFFPLKDFMF